MIRLALAGALLALPAAAARAEDIDIRDEDVEWIAEMAADLAAARVEDAALAVSVRERRGGKLEPGVAILRLDCSKGLCRLGYEPIGRCVSGKFKPFAWEIGPEKLSVSQDRQADLYRVSYSYDEKEKGGMTTYTLEFGHEPTGFVPLNLGLKSFTGGWRSPTQSAAWEPVTAVGADQADFVVACATATVPALRKEK